MSEKFETKFKEQGDEGKDDDTEKEVAKKEIRELTEEEIKLINEKAESAYEDNLVLRFTNAAFLDDVFITKNEFRGNAMLVMESDDDYQRYYREKNYPRLPKGKATLGVLVDKVYHEIDTSECSEREKNYAWDDYAYDHTDWMGTGGNHYARELAKIKEIKRQSAGRADFADRMRAYVMERFDLKSEQPPKNQVLREILEGKDYFQKPGKLREYLHNMGGMDFGRREEDEKSLKSRRDIRRYYNIGIIASTDAVKSYGYFGRASWCKFKKFEKIDIGKDFKGIICTIRDRFFEQKVIEEMIELTKDNPKARVPVFDVDGNQIYPERRKREEIEKIIKQKKETK